MSTLRQYRRRELTPVIAVRLDLDTDGFTYRKWGASQRANPGDWVVNNDGDTYTVDSDSFARTYSEQSPGVYVKRAFVWARMAQTDGAIATKEGETNYKAGDYIVFNDAHGRDGYAISTEAFHKLYELVE